MSDAEEPTTEQQKRANDTSRDLHKQAEQLNHHAEQLDDDASAAHAEADDMGCLLYTSPSPRDS